MNTDETLNSAPPTLRAAAAISTSRAAIARLEDRVEIIDALYRFAAGQDLHDPMLLRSAFAENAILDFVQPAKRFGVDLQPFAGRENIVDSIWAALAELDTTHTVTNPRVDIKGNEATLFSLVEAQHVLRQDRGRNLLLKNFYWVWLERAGEKWAITRMRIENAWHAGDPKVLFP